MWLTNKNYKGAKTGKEIPTHCNYSQREIRLKSTFKKHHE